MHWRSRATTIKCSTQGPRRKPRDVKDGQFNFTSTRHFPLMWEQTLGGNSYKWLTSNSQSMESLGKSWTDTHGSCPTAAWTTLQRRFQATTTRFSPEKGGPMTHQGQLQKDWVPFGESLPGTMLYIPGAFVIQPHFTNIQLLWTGWQLFQGEIPGTQVIFWKSKVQREHNSVCQGMGSHGQRSPCSFEMEHTAHNKTIQGGYENMRSMPAGENKNLIRKRWSGEDPKQCCPPQQKNRSYSKM